MAKWMRVTLKVTAAIAAILIAVLAALPWGVNCLVIPRLVNRCSAEYLDAVPSWKRIHLSLYRYLPRVRLEVDSLKLDFNSPLWGSYAPELTIARADIFASYIDGKVDGDGTLSAEVDGLALSADARVSDVLGDDPRIVLDASADALLKRLVQDLGLDLAVKPAGKAHLDLSAEALLSQIRSLDYRHASVQGRLSSDFLLVSMPEDSLRASLYAPILSVHTRPEGIDASLTLDSLGMRKGAGIQVKVRGMENSARLFDVEKNGRMTPRMELSVSGKSAFLRAGASRVGIRSIDVGLQAQKRVRMSDEERRRRFGGARIDSLRRAAREREAATDSLLLDSDITISIDSSITALIREWNPTGSISMGRGFVASPALPLRTRISGLRGSFDGDELLVDTLGLRCGTSDISASGSLKGIRRALRRKGYISTHLDLHSERININELVAAVQLGKTVSRDTSLVEDDESFVRDSIQNAEFDRDGIRAFLMPGNVDASVRLLADQVNFKDMLVTPMRVEMKLKDRVLQLSDADMNTSVGHIGLSAYYSTKTLDDLNLGMNLQLDSMRAHDIISLLPSVDSLMPVLKSFEGLLGCSISATTKVDRDMMAIMPTMEGVVRLSGTDLNISDVGNLRRITRLLMFKNKDIGHIEDLSVNAVLHNSRLEIFPFELKADRYRLALQGVQNFDGSMYYHVSVLKSPIPFKFGLDFYGTFDKWRFGLARAKYVDGKVPAFTRELDMMQLNIFDSIEGIFKRGVQDVEKYNRHYSGISYDREPGLLDDAEAAQAQMAIFGPEDAVSFEEEAVAREVEAVLEESYADIEVMLKSYQQQIYSKRELRRMEKALNSGK